jgi:ATP-binding cassette, subfamily C, bacterial CydD
VRALDPRLLRRARAARIALGADAILGIVAALLVLAQAGLLARVVARSFDGGSLDDVREPLALLVVVVAARAASTWGFETIGTHAAAGVVSQLRLDLVTSRLQGNPTALDGAESAEVATAAVGGVAALEGLLGRFLPQVVLAVVVPIAVLALVASLDLVSAGLMLLTLPLVPVFFWLIGRATGHRARERWEAMSLLATHFLDVVRGLPTLRAFNRGEAQAGRIEAVSEEYRRATMGTLRLAFLSGTVLELAATLGVALVAVTVGVRLVDGGIAFEPALTILVLAPELYLPLRNLAAGFHASADGAAVAERLLGLIEQPAAVATGTKDPPSPREAAIRFESVSYSYPDRPTPAVDELSLTIEPGETIALVGASGGGKSTLAGLLLRFRAPAAGRILIGGVDLAACDAVAWHRHIAWVPQSPTLFRGTVADNIRLGDARASAERVREAASLAGADRVVAALPNGYETVVGEGGRVLSTGERQRIALARAFLRDAPLVILDEPTANVDPAAALVVADAIDRLRAGRTTLLIAHDPALAAHSDRVVTVEGGRVVTSS